VIDLGSVYQVAVDVRDPSGQLADPASATLTITLPDGTTETPAVVLPPPSTGQLRVEYTPAQAGRYVWRMVTSAPTTAYTDIFDVRPADPHFLFSQADAKRHLNIDASDTDFDDEIRDWNAATALIVERFVGPIVQHTVIERHRDRFMTSIVLRQTPAIALTSVEAVLTSGASYDVSGLDLDGATGEVIRLDGGSFKGPLNVTYTAGRTVIPANAAQAGRIILQHLWRTRRGRMGVAMGGDDYDVSEPIAGLGYAVPNRALELLEPDRLAPGVA
jgi:hypothetical protein